MYPNSTVLVFAVVACSVALIESCGIIDPGTIITGPTGTVLQRKMGPLIREVGKPPSKPDGEVITSVDQLSCSSSSRENCCWRQGSQSTIDWVAATGISDVTLMNTHFAGQGQPTGVGFLAAYSNEAKAGGAILESCVITCVEDEFTVGLQSWQTSEVSLVACVTPATNFNPTNCVPVAPGQVSVTVQPLNEPMRLILMSTDYTDPTGNIVALDNLNVAATISQDQNCNGVDPTEVCKKTTCSFDEGDSCSYQGFTGGDGWGLKTGRLGNPNTGVRRAAPGSEPTYAGVEVEKGAKRVMRSGPIDVPEPMELKFKAYEATMDVVLKACINNENNCPWQSNPRISAADLKWQEGTIPIDANTKEVLFVAQSTGNHFSAVGVDDIRLYSGNGGGQVNC